MDQDDRPLVERLEVSTRSTAEAEEFVRQSYPGTRTRFHGPADDRGHIAIEAANAGTISTDHVRSSVGFTTGVEPRRYFCSAVLRRGRYEVRNGREETICSAGETCQYPMDVELDLELSDLDVRTLRLPIEPLEEAAEEAAGIDAADVRFDSASPISTAAARRWSAFVEMASDLLLSTTPPASPILIGELTHSAAITALHTFPNSALTVPYQRGQGWVAESAARRAAAFIQAHAGEPVTMKEIAAVAGVSTRALRDAFRRHYDTTPIGYLRQVRLERVRAELQEADLAEEIVLDQVARRWGWTSARRLTTAYQKRFGELPGHGQRPQQG